MRKVLLGFAVLLVICVGLYLRFRHSKPPLEVAFAANREVTLQSTTAQVREPVATVNFGDRLEVLQRFQDQVEVRTMTGVTGWVNGHELLSADLWQRAADLARKAGEMRRQAVGHTKTLTNIHVEPGRESPRIQQLGKGTFVEVIERSVVAVPSAPNAGGGEGAGNTGGEPKREDWWLVRTRPAEKKGAVDLAGWVLGKYVQLDLPRPLGDLVSTSGVRAVGWQELNFVADPSSGKKWQYLVLGIHGPEGQPCDFTMLRVYTWGVHHQRYETAFIDGKVCGKFPVKLIQPSGGAGDVTFSFEDIGKGAASSHVVRLLPSFDCYPMFYSPRELFVSEAHRSKIFRQTAGWNYPALIVDGTAAGTWNLKRHGRKIEVGVEPFRALKTIEKRGVCEEAADIGEFLGAPAEVKFSSVSRL